MHTCKVCSKTFVYKGTLDRHLENYHNITDLKHPCKICEKSFKDERSLKLHAQRSHETVDCVKCEYCEKTFVTQHNAKLHVATVHEKTSRKYKCEYCEKKYRRARQPAAFQPAVFLTCGFIFGTKTC